MGYIGGPNEPWRGALQAAVCVFTALRLMNPLQRGFHSTSLGGEELSINPEMQS